MKNRSTLKRHSVGFRFCCSSKYQTSELQSFSQVFPTVPIVGMEAYGEIGWNCYPDRLENLSCTKRLVTIFKELLKRGFLGKSNKRKRLKNNGFPNAENEFSTVFVLLTWD